MKAYDPYWKVREAEEELGYPWDAPPEASSSPMDDSDVEQGDLAVTPEITDEHHLLIHAAVYALAVKYQVPAHSNSPPKSSPRPPSPVGTTESSPGRSSMLKSIPRTMPSSCALWWWCIR